VSQPSPRKVAKSLQQLVEARKPDALIDRFMRWALNNYVNAENLRNAISSNIDILFLSLNHFHLGHPLVSPIFRLALQMFWAQFIETYIADATKIYNILAQKPECKAILDTPEGIDYLNRCCKASYESLYAFTWEGYPTET